jgi:glycosyltransferase involved in cell wall biosynthesis
MLFAGKLEKKKNPLFIIEAAKTFQEIHFIIIGNGALEKEVIKQAQNIGNLSLLPFQNQTLMPVAYRLADIFILPSQGPGETWGLALNEAMACGRIVVASNKCGGAVDLIENGVNGYIINPDVNSLLTTITLLLSDKTRFPLLKKSSLEKIRKFSFERIASAIEVCLNKTPSV